MPLQPLHSHSLARRSETYEAKSSIRHGLCWLQIKISQKFRPPSRHMRCLAARRTSALMSRKTLLFLQCKDKASTITLLVGLGGSIRT